MNTIITTEEVERLLRVVAPDLRTNWEKKHNKGESLVLVAQKRSQAILQIEQCKKTLAKYTPVVIIFIVTALVAMFFPTNMVRSLNVLTRIIIFVGLCAMMFLSATHNIRLDNKIKRANQDFSECNWAFEHFGRSVEALNPHRIGNIYHDVVDRAYVLNYLRRHAFMVLDAQRALAQVCKVDPIVRHDVSHAANWVDKCESVFDRAWYAATEDFLLDLDKAGVFATAAQDLARRQ